MSFIRVTFTLICIPVTLKHLRAGFISSCQSPTDSSLSHIYSPSLLPFFEFFAEYLLSICYAFVREPEELHYIAAACWPLVAQPFLDQRLGGSALPTEQERLTLLSRVKPEITAALENLYPRRTNANSFVAARTASSSRTAPRNPTEQNILSQVGSFPRMSQFIVVASYLASTNPAKTDLRMFGRGPDERKKRKGGGTRKARGRAPAVSKLPQRLTGPVPAPLDRILAILGVLLEENDVETRPPGGGHFLPGEQTDLELARVQVMSTIVELSSMRLIHRTTPSDRLDGPPMFKCAISHDEALAICKLLNVPLNDLVWDPV